MRYLIISLCLFLFVGCGESEYERCLKVEKAKVVENWDDIDQIVKRSVMNFDISSLNFRGVLDNEVTSAQDIQRLRDSLQVLADMPLLEIQKKFKEMVAQGIEMDSDTSVYAEVVQAWDQYLDLAYNLLRDEELRLMDSLIDDAVTSHERIATKDNQVLYFGTPDEIMLEVHYKLIGELEKSNQEAMVKLATVQKEIASNICNSRGLY